MQIATAFESVVLRPWAPQHQAGLVIQANDRAVWRNLLVGFPSPYTDDDARLWITEGCKAERSLHLCIEVAGAVAGGVGVALGSGSSEKTGQFGYWLGKAYWGRGIATAAAAAMLRHVLATMPVARLEAPVFDWNPASMRVLEKVGFKREAVLRKSVFKDDKLIDSVLYAYVVDDA
jgi:RimJ/RimL family protein N-acetyltransferase